MRLPMFVVEGGAKFLGERGRACERRVWQEDCELVSAESRGDVCCANAVLDQACDGVEDLVADLVAVFVVDALESVKVGEEQ